MRVSIQDQHITSPPLAESPIPLGSEAAHMPRLPRVFSLSTWELDRKVRAHAPRQNGPIAISHPPLGRKPIQGKRIMNPLDIFINFYQIISLLSHTNLTNLTKNASLHSRLPSGMQALGKPTSAGEATRNL